MFHSAPEKPWDLNYESGPRINDFKDDYFEKLRQYEHFSQWKDKYDYRYGRWTF